MALLTTPVLGTFWHVSAQGGPNWLANDAPTVNKLVDLPSDTPFTKNNVNCEPYSYVPAGSLRTDTVCTFDSPLGTLTEQGGLQVAPDQFVPLAGPSRSSFFIPTPVAGMAVVSLPSGQAGNYVGVYEHLSKSDLMFNFVSYGAPYYSVTVPPDKLISDPVTGRPLQIDASSIAFSGSGEWMVADMQNEGLLRVHMTDLSVWLFAGPIEPGGYTGTSPSVPMAITDAGRYVAVNTDVYGRNDLRVYDVSTCTDQLNVLPRRASYCAYKDIWHGKGIAAGVLAAHQDLWQPFHLQFTTDDDLDFYARYGISVSGYKTANFVATAPGGEQHGLGLLGMGDSYISGQGTYAYRTGTDTANDQCHVSDLAYPFILGRQVFDSYESVACSGARTFNVIGSKPSYTGQVKDRVPEDQRNKPKILSSFLPGYIYQQEFAAAYKPDAILVSVGGDDIGFADIVKQCVMPGGGGTCYSTYEDRAELVNEIDSIYSKLVHTYTVLRQQSNGARVYAVGYPQVALPGGDCGDNVHLNSAELVFSAQVITYLDSVVRQAADTAGVFYVDTQNAFNGHRLCEAGDKAMNGLTIKAGLSMDPVAPESYHPTQLGYRLLAQTIAEQTGDLSAPMPTPAPYQVPVFDPTQPLLEGGTITGRKINWVTHDDSIAGDFVLRGDLQQVTVDGSEVQLKPGGDYQIVLHSNPILLGVGKVSADGNVAASVRMPSDVPPGYHVLHMYGTNMAGEPVDVQKVIYVAASASDYDGDGVSNTANPCRVVQLSGQDADRDGIDDACDPVISPAIVDTHEPVVTSAVQNSPEAQDNSQAATAKKQATAESSHSDLQGSEVLGDSTPNTTNAQDNMVATTVPRSSHTEHLAHESHMIVLVAIVLAAVSGLLVFYRRSYR